MKKVIASLCIGLFLAFAAPGCKSTCEKAFDKGVKCMEDMGEPGKKEAEKMKKKKDDFMKECKKKEGKIKDCVGKDSCKDFMKCFEKAM